MGKYVINIEYTTGNSLNSERVIEPLELSWDNIDVAKENLNAIKEHYKNVYLPIDSLRSNKKDAEKIYKKFESEWWFTNDKKLYSISKDTAIDKSQLDRYLNDHEWRNDEYGCTHIINLKTDDGTLLRMGCFWIGYFETLHSAEIIKDDSDMKFYI